MCVFSADFSIRYDIVAADFKRYDSKLPPASLVRVHSVGTTARKEAGVTTENLQKTADFWKNCSFSKILKKLQFPEKACIRCNLARVCCRYAGKSSSRVLGKSLKFSELSTPLHSSTRPNRNTRSKISLFRKKNCSYFWKSVVLSENCSSCSYAWCECRFEEILLWTSTKKNAEKNSRAIAINRPSEYEEQNPNFRLQIL